MAEFLVLLIPVGLYGLSWAVAEWLAPKVGAA